MLIYCFDVILDEHREIESFPLYDLIPYYGNGFSHRGYQIVHYIGSLTTPGCNGDVDWYVIIGAMLMINERLVSLLAPSKKFKLKFWN